ncbi:MAG TPA: efflux RND transporter periplasmic adaptor subunit [Roseiflexaceae bacterium]|nr:efflux RND transporter periplasmic adaptor subunit [Roseiflexaceae bacterium]
MATTTLPQQRVSAHRGRWIAAGIALIALAIIAAVLLSTRRGSAAATAATSPVTRGTIVANVAGTGSVAAAQSLDLAFQTSGTVTKVLVKEGDQVQAGQPLAQLDDRELQLKVADAQASLQSAQARLAQAQQGNSTPEDIAASQAGVANAEANLQKARTGNTTAADVASAEAQLRSAQAQLDALKNPAGANLSTAELKVTQAQNDLNSTRTSASAAKTNAELSMRQAADNLTKAQAAYASAKQNWDYVQATGADPANPKTTDPATGKEKKNKLNDVQKRQYYETFVQAEASMHSAEKDLTAAQVSYDKARQDEVAQIQRAEATLADAQRQLDALKNPTATDLVQAQASVDQARANLQKLRQGGTQADIAAAQASVDQAKANLQKLTAPATETDLQVQQASVAQAEQTLKQAQLALEQATLKAPFAGVITAVDIVPGSGAGTGTPAISLIDRSTLHVDMALSENDVARVQLGQPVTITIDALDDWTAQGTVSYIAPAATTTNDVVTYPVRVSFPDTEARVKVGMTANISIVTATKDNVLLVPNTALLPKGAGHAVQVPADGGGTREVEVQTGLTDGTQTEIVSGLQAGDQVIANPTTGASTRQGGPFGR